MRSIYFLSHLCHTWNDERLFIKKNMTLLMVLWEPRVKVHTRVKANKSKVKVGVGTTGMCSLTCGQGSGRCPMPSRFVHNDHIQIPNFRESIHLCAIMNPAWNGLLALLQWVVSSLAIVEWTNTKPSLYVLGRSDKGAAKATHTLPFSCDLRELWDWRTWNKALCPSRTCQKSRQKEGTFTCTDSSELGRRERS